MKKIIVTFDHITDDVRASVLVNGKVLMQDVIDVSQVELSQKQFEATDEMVQSMIEKGDGSMARIATFFAGLDEDEITIATRALDAGISLAHKNRSHRIRITSQIARSPEGESIARFVERAHKDSLRALTQGFPEALKEHPGLVGLPSLDEKDLCENVANLITLIFFGSVIFILTNPELSEHDMMHQTIESLFNLMNR